MRFVSGSTFRSIWQPTPQNVQVVFVFDEPRLACGRRALLELLVDRAGRADREAAAAELALGVEPALAPRRHDARLRPAALERERRALHHLLRVADAARAEDAGVGVVAHQQVAVLVRLALRVRQHDRRLDPEILGERDELVRPPARVRVQVLGEEHLGQRALELRHRRVRRDHHPLGDPSRARRHRPRRALDADDAHPAAAVRVELVVVAEGRDEDVVAGERVDEQLALGRGDVAAVDGELDYGARHCAFNRVTSARTKGAVDGPIFRFTVPSAHITTQPRFALSKCRAAMWRRPWIFASTMREAVAPVRRLAGLHRLPLLRPVEAGDRAPDREAGDDSGDHASTSGQWRWTLRQGIGDACPSPQIEVCAIASSHSSTFGAASCASPAAIACQRAVADPARSALLARLLGEEAHRLGEQAQHGVARGEDLHRRRAGPAVPLPQRVARQRNVEGGRREDPARRAAGNDRADLVREAARVGLDERARRHVERRPVAPGLRSPPRRPTTAARASTPRAGSARRARASRRC